MFSELVTAEAKVDSEAVSCCKSCLFDEEISCNSEDINAALAWK